MPIIKQRMTAAVEGDFCVFVIAMRVNRWLRVHKWWPVAIAMPRMVKELKAAPESGFLGAEQALGIRPSCDEIRSDLLARRLRAGAGNIEDRMRGSHVCFDVID